MDRQLLENMVREVNKSEVSKEDYLSDGVFFYDSVKKEILLASDYEKKQSNTSTSVLTRPA